MTNAWSPGCVCCNDVPTCVQCQNFVSVTVSGISGACANCATNYEGTYPLTYPTTFCKQAFELKGPFDCGDVTISTTGIVNLSIRSFVSCIVYTVATGYACRVTLAAVYYKTDSNPLTESYHESYFEKITQSCAGLKGDIPFAGEADSPQFGATYGDYCGLSGATITLNM